MGLTQSSRKITITNDDDTKLITLSSALVERLAQGTLDDSSSASRNAAAASTTVPVTSTAPERQPYNPPPVNPRSETYERFPHEYTLSALQMQQQKEMELQDQELYWQNRLQNLEKNHVLINQIFDAEHKKAVDEFVNKKGSVEGSMTPCLENSQQVIKCYQDHPREILKCADVVEQFSNCVDQRRAHVVAAR